MDKLPCTARVLLSVAVAGAACSGRPGTARGDRAADLPATGDLVFLTRDGCVYSATMRAHLDEALQTLDLDSEYSVVDLGTLAASDARVGYPTPTLLYQGRDLFGMATPTPPFPDPT